jgi:hypothetical protein
MSIVTVLVSIGIVGVASMALAPHGEAETPPDQKPSSKQPVFACRVGALTAQERVQQQEIRTRLQRGTTRVAEDTEGYTFHYAADVPAATVITWVEMERKCCPFLRFTLDLPEDGGPSRLRVWGVQGAKAFLAAEMKSE